MMCATLAPPAPLQLAPRSACFTLQRRMHRRETQVFPPAPASAQVGAAASLPPRVYVPMAFFPI